ncbi:hypothetical protein RB195_013255 [Necator americanus]|uniref:Uncharacterized protein n=1 Tax=Necator americanus TaxID=51031 RepID=A0ABR1DUP4_NECAM
MSYVGSNRHLKRTVLSAAAYAIAYVLHVVLTRLYTVESKRHEAPTAAQTGAVERRVMKEYIKQSTGNNMDQLVFYIPCSYVYRGDSDQANFVQLMKDAGTSDRTLIVSLTNNATDVGKWYEQGDQNVIGIDTPNAVNKTVAFGSNREHPVTSSTAQPTTTGASTLQPQALLRQVELLHREQQPQSLPPLHSLQAQALLRQVELLRHQQQQPQSLPPLHSLQAQALLRQVELLGTATSVTSSTAQPTSTGLLRQVELLHF